MAKYLLAYRGGSVPQTEEEQAAVMDAWMAWFGGLGDAVVDGGNPFAGSQSLGSDGSVSDGAPSQLTGYSIIDADDLATASKLAGGCPVLAAGGSVDVYETLAM